MLVGTDVGLIVVLYGCYPAVTYFWSCIDACMTLQDVKRQSETLVIDLS